MSLADDIIGKECLGMDFGTVHDLFRIFLSVRNDYKLSLEQIPFSFVKPTGILHPLIAGVITKVTRQKIYWSRKDVNTYLTLLLKSMELKSTVLTLIQFNLLFKVFVFLVILTNLLLI